MSEVAVAPGIDLEILPKDDLSIPEGWQLLTDESVEEPDGPVTLEDVAVLEDGESYVSGEKMLKRAIKSGKRAGLRAAKALLRQQHLIPVEWRGKKVLVFTGAVGRYRGGSRDVAYLYWYGDRWYLDWYWLVSDFDSLFRAVRCSRNK